MKKIELFDEIFPANVKEGIDLAKTLWLRHPVAGKLFLLTCLNVAIAPAVYAASGEQLTRTAAWALGLLGILTLGLSLYLWVVIFQPERF